MEATAERCGGIVLAVEPRAPDGRRSVGMIIVAVVVIVIIGIRFTGRSRGSLHRACSARGRPQAECHHGGIIKARRIVTYKIYLRSSK